jgi:thiosulfate/3-mercaptopyruvate sulfurtransferase
MVSTAWLADRAREDAVAVIDASWFMPGAARDAKAEFTAAHIPGAVFFGIDEVCDRNAGLPHMLASPEAFAAAMRDLGVRAGSAVVVYDSQGLFSAPRLWWNLRIMGCETVGVLDGGLPAWVAEGRPLEAGWPDPPPGDFEAHFRPDLIRDLEAVRRALAGGSAQIIDARPSGRFLGQISEPRAGLRSGHMPGALNIPFTQVVDSGRLASAERLAAVFRSAGTDLERPIVTTCGSGISAALLALALARLGRDDVAVYDGSWAEWGARSDTPIVAEGEGRPP